MFSGTLLQIHNTPMIVGDIGNNGTLVIDGFNGMKFKFDDSDDLLRMIEKFEGIDDGKLRHNAYDDYQTKYSPEANYIKLQDIYGEVR